MTLDWVEEIFGEKKKEMKEITFSGKIYEAPCLLHVPLSLLLGGQRLPRYARPRGIDSAVCKPSMRN